MSYSVGPNGVGNGGALHAQCALYRLQMYSLRDYGSVHGGSTSPSPPRHYRSICFQKCLYIAFFDHSVPPMYTQARDRWEYRWLRGSGIT
jgi:hypothetical protein